MPFTPGKLAEGGDLYVLKVVGQPNANLGGDLPLGTTWDVEWARVDDPLATTTSCYQQGAADGGAQVQPARGSLVG